ncbi:hypothetical protein B5B98_04715 [Staphylococcus delphini]|nr:hypothetical protein B5B98_04715 [Staphylococcus delphini]
MPFFKWNDMSHVKQGTLMAHDWIERQANISDTYTNDAVFCKMVILAHKGGTRNGTRTLDRI